MDVCASFRATMTQTRAQTCTQRFKTERRIIRHAQFEMMWISCDTLSTWTAANNYLFIFQSAKYFLFVWSKNCEKQTKKKHNFSLHGLKLLLFYRVTIENPTKHSIYNHISQNSSKSSNLRIWTEKNFWNCCLKSDFINLSLYRLLVDYWLINKST